MLIIEIISLKDFELENGRMNAIYWYWGDPPLLLRESGGGKMETTVFENQYKIHKKIKTKTKKE